MTNTARPTVALQLQEARARFVDFVERRVGSRALAEDIVQDAFVKSIEHEGDLHSEETAVAWFYRVLRNAVIDHYRRSSTAAKALEGWKLEFEREQAPSPEMRGEICQCLFSALDGLKPEYKLAIERVEMQDQPIAALAGELGITPGNAAVRLHRARTALRTQVKDCCSSCDACTCEPPPKSAAPPCH
jgi:RNA polymerase sigma-70 factor (ECF subfamily)